MSYVRLLTLFALAVTATSSCSRKTERPTSENAHRDSGVNTVRASKSGDFTSSGPRIDLVRGTIDQRRLAELTLDKVTDLFGKPTAVTDPTPETGPILVYANQGLVFRFKRSILADSQTQRLASIIVYLTAQEDSETHVSCSGYRGTFAQGITSDWKAPMVMQSFGQYTPTDSYDPLFAERARLGETVDTALNKMSVPGGAPIRAKSLISTITFVTVKFPGSQAMFQYEENTKFLQYVEIIPR